MLFLLDFYQLVSQSFSLFLMSLPILLEVSLVFGHYSFLYVGYFELVPPPSSVYIIQFRILTSMHNCLVSSAPSYLRDLCTSVSSVSGRGTLQSAGHGLLVVSCMRTATAHAKSFAYVEPKSWNHVSKEL